MRLMLLVVTLWIGITTHSTGQDKDSDSRNRYVLEPLSWENQSPETLPERAICRLGSLRFRHWTCYAGHPVVIRSDGKLLITGGDQRIRFWEYPSGKLVYEYNHAHSHVFNMLLSPDDRYLVGRYETCFAMDVQQRKMIKNFGDKGTTPLCFSPDAKFLVTTEGRELVWYRTQDWGVEKRWKFNEQMEQVHQAQFLEKGSVLQTINWYRNKVITLWDVAEGTVKEQFTLQLPVQQRTATYTRDGKHVVIVPYSRESVQVYDIRTGKKLRELQGPVSCSLYGLVFSPDGKTLLTNWFKDEKGEDGRKGFQLSLWDYQTGTLKKRFPVQGEMDYYFFPDGKTVTSSYDTVFHFYDTETGKQPGGERPLEHFGMVTSLLFSPDGKSLFSCGRNIIQWDLQQRQPARTFGASYGYGPRLSPDGRTMIFTDGASTIRSVETSSCKEIHAFSVPRDTEGGTDQSHQPHLGTTHFATDSKSYYTQVTRHGYQKNGQAAVPGWSQWLRIDAVTGKVLWKGPQLDQSGFQYMLRDGVTGLSIEYGNINLVPGTIRVQSEMKIVPATPQTNFCVLFDIRSHRRRTVFAIPDRSTSGFDHSPRGNTLLGCSSRECGKTEQGWNREEYTIYLWETATGKQRLAIPLREQSVLHWFLGKLVFSPDARRIAGFRIDGTIMIWDAITGALIWEQATRLPKVQAAAFSPDGTMLATGHEDTTIVLWNVADLTRPPAPSKISAHDLENWWKDLSGPDADKAYQAIWKLADAGETATQFIRQRVKPMKPLDAQEVSRWLDQLDSKTFAERNEASAKLAQAGLQVEAALAQALKQNPRPEVRKRLEQLWSQSPAISPDGVTALRAIEVLHHQGTKEAWSIVTELVNGDPAHAVTQAARLAQATWR